MGLSQSIVIKSRFSVPQGHGKGSRGGTPGKFVMRYMARAAATENLAPTKLRDTDALLDRYDAMAQAAKDAVSVADMKERMHNTRRRGGIAFGDGNASLSDSKIRELSEDMQRRFEGGKTAIETVISFDEQYLRDNGILDDGFICEKRGDLVGQVDQLKLRLAIMNGIEKIKPNYDDLHYAGVIHVDTEHVHCHLLMMDYGIGTLSGDGTQRGKITPSNLRSIRRGIDTYLDAKQSVKMMSSSVMQDRQNVLCHVKRFMHQSVAQQGFPQFLLACLPENRNWWTANSNRKEMQKPNALVRDFVMEVLQPTSGVPTPMYQAAHKSIVSYADTRQAREGISEQERLKLIRQGEERLVRDCMNGVYSVLKSIPENQLVLRTPVMDMMSMDYDSMAAQAVNDPGMEFGLKLRSYSTRLQHHRKEYIKFRDECREYETLDQKSADSEALAQYLAYERNYQQMLMTKYQYFLSFLPPDEDFEDEFESVMKQQDRVYKMEQMEHDTSLHRMGAVAAEQYGVQVYGLTRGSFIKHSPGLWQRRMEVEKRKYADSVERFRDRLQLYGFDFDGHGVIRDKRYLFDDVKSLDLHHLGYDFPYEAQISKRNADRFVEVANRRYELFQGAKDYLVQTGQEDALRELDEHDVVQMKSFADQLTRGVSSVVSKRGHAGKSHTGLTIRLGRDYTIDMEEVVRATVQTTSYTYE